jgi:hypothetical protein
MADLPQEQELPENIRYLKTTPHHKSRSVLLKAGHHFTVKILAMKSMLYVGAALMIGASIYGFVDYRETSRKKEFKKMYEHKDVNKPVVIEEKKSIVVEKKEDVKKETVETKKASTITAKKEKKVTEKPVVRKKKRFDYRKFSRAPLREEEELPEIDSSSIGNKQ